MKTFYQNFDISRPHDPSAVIERDEEEKKKEPELFVWWQDRSIVRVAVERMLLSPW
jgi:hypothetical protein